MPACKRAARAGIAAVALGLSLAGPTGIAAADPGDDDTSSLSGSHHSRSNEAPGRSRPARAAQDTRSDAEPGRDVRPSAADRGESAAALTTLSPSRLAGRHSDVDPGSTVPAASRSAHEAFTAIPAASDSNLSMSLGFGPSAVAPAAALRIDTLPPHPVATAVRTLLTGPPPPALAKPIAAISTSVTTLFDSTANWLSGLPGGQVADFLEGALLLVRRTFFNLFPMLNPGQTTGQTSGTYFTDEGMRTYLLDIAKQRYGGLFGTTVPVYGYGPYPEYLKTDTSSDTNTQVDGVDEADFVEHDGQYIYTAHNGQLTIVRADDLSVASQSTLSGDVAGEYLAGDRLTVITQSGSGWYGPQVKMAYPGYWQPWNPQTTVTVYDVSDRTAPAVVSQTVFDGAYESSRSVDGVVYVVMQRSVNVPAPHYTETPVVYVENAGAQDDPVAAAKIRYDPSAPVAYRTYETWDEYIARVGDTIVVDSLPHAYTVDAQGNTVDLGVVADPEDIVRPHSSADQDGRQSVLTVVSLDSGQAAGGPAFADSVGSMVTTDGGAVYMTPDALYVANNEDHYTDSGYSTDTRIERFSIAGTDVAWQSSGVVPGTLINQFAMDEKDGYLRVATHTNSWSDGTRQDDNGIYVLDAETLEEVGRLTGLAPGEQLYAVRYVGDTAYLVTFVRVDPLFAVDLSDPTAPTLLGELKVPGFSNYLQPVGDGLLLGIGQEREDGNWNTHLHATVFDVSDGAKMTQVDREFLDPGYQWSWSDAQFDHHAVLYTQEDGLLVVPVSGSGYDPETGYKSAQYLKVLRVGPGGIETIGEIHPAEPTLRTVRIGDVLYAVGDTTVTAYRISDLSQIGSSAPAPAVV